MPQLSKILSSILQDVATAQHEANMYSLRLASAYRDQNQGATLNAPAALISDIDLTLQCAFSEEFAEKDILHINQTFLNRTLKDLSSDLTSLVYDTISSVILQQNNAIESNGPIARLQRDQTLKKDFLNFLSDEMFRYLKGRRTEYIKSDGSIDYAGMQEGILNVAYEIILTHPDLNLNGTDDSDRLRKSILENLTEKIKTTLPLLLKGTKIGSPERHQSLEVIIASDALEKIPANAIQTINLKISTRSLPGEE